MSPKKSDVRTQRDRFVEVAREVGASEDEEVFDAILKKVAEEGKDGKGSSRAYAHHALIWMQQVRLDMGLTAGLQDAADKLSAPGISKPDGEKKPGPDKKAKASEKKSAPSVPAAKKPEH